MSMDPSQIDQFLQETMGQLDVDPGAEPMPQESEPSSPLPMETDTETPAQMDAMPPEMEGAIAPEPAAVDPTPVMQAILQTIQDVLGRGKELDTKVLADAVNTFASAFSTLSKTISEGGIAPQDQLMMEQQKMEHEQMLAEQKAAMELEMSQQKLELEKAKAMMDMHLKRQTAEQDAAHKDEMHQSELQNRQQQVQQQSESHQQQLSLNERKAQEAQADASTNRTLKVQESQARVNAARSKPKQSGGASS